MSTNDPNTTPTGYRERGEEIARLRAELEAAQRAPVAATASDPNVVAPATPPLAEAPPLDEPAVPSEPTTAAIGVTAPTVAAGVDEPTGQPTTHAIAPGSAGPTVREFAQLLELAGERTYLTDSTVQNAADVFTDDLLEAARRVLHDHPTIAGSDGAERQRLNRWISGLELVTAEVWNLVNDVASSKAPAA